MEENWFVPNISNATNSQSTHGQSYHEHNFLLCYILLTNILSFVSNLLAITAICLVKKLRKSLSSVYTFSLCLLDLVASTTVLPKSVAVIATGHWAWHDNLCRVNGVFNAFLVFAVILTICARDLEKYYCIKHPMHHAGHMTVMTAIVSIGIAWTSAIVLAMFPLVLWNGYQFRPKSLQCTYFWERKKANVIFGMFVTFVFLLVPFILMIHINCTMYQIAKRAMRQIQPIGIDNSKGTKTRVRLSIIVTRTHGETSRKQPESPELTTTTFSRNNSQPTDFKHVPDSVSINSGFRYDIGNRDITTLQDLQRCSAKSCSSFSLCESAIMRDTLIRPSTNYKALKSLILPFLYFFAIWGSYFITHFTWLIGVHHSFSMETVCTLIIYTSYLLNPFVYGFLNKSFRDECFLLLQERMCAPRDPDTLTPPPPPCENFMEFLQRTSYANQGQDPNMGKQSIEERAFIRPSVIMCQEGMPNID